VLGLEPSASAATVRKRYLRLALKLHPDKAAHVRAAEAFAALEHAYEHAYKRAQRGRRQDTLVSSQC
jgi:DnaJ-class molecular chaperone